MRSTEVHYSLVTGWDEIDRGLLLFCLRVGVKGKPSFPYLSFLEANPSSVYISQEDNIKQ